MRAGEANRSIRAGVKPAKNIGLGPMHPWDAVAQTKNVTVRLKQKKES